MSAISDVREVLDKIRFPMYRLVIREGLFSETFQQSLPESVALLHIDADWYSSVLESLKTFYSLVSENGVIILDDFGHWEGTRKAFYTFCREFHVEPLLERVG